jgi:ribosome-associated protein
VVPDDDDEVEELSARQQKRADQRDAGQRSAKLANALMKLSAVALDKVKLDDDIRVSVDRARAVKSLIARRRAERALAGELRRYELADVEIQLGTIRETAQSESERFKEAERWRARLIDEGTAVLASFPGGGDKQLPTLIENAQREKKTGKPAGAARALFRHVAELLRRSAIGGS